MCPPGFTDVYRLVDWMGVAFRPTPYTHLPYIHLGLPMFTIWLIGWVWRSAPPIPHKVLWGFFWHPLPSHGRANLAVVVLVAVVGLCAALVPALRAGSARGSSPREGRRVCGRGGRPPPAPRPAPLSRGGACALGAGAGARPRT